MDVQNVLVVTHSTISKKAISQLYERIQNQD